MDIKLIVNIASRAWALPVLAALHDGVPGRQSRLIGATGASRTAFGQSLEHLIACDLLERNPGHGHPLRPEFRLTPAGKQMAQKASQIMAATPAPQHKILRRSWTLPVLTTLHEPQHFGLIKAQLGTISDRALAQSLRVMEDHNWLARHVSADLRPPRPIYVAQNTGRLISQITRSASPV